MRNLWEIKRISLTFVQNFVGELLVQLEFADLRQSLREQRRMNLHSAFQLSKNEHFADSQSKFLKNVSKQPRKFRAH
jgi:hypothetical protein